MLCNCATFSSEHWHFWRTIKNEKWSIKLPIVFEIEAWKSHNPRYCKLLLISPSSYNTPPPPTLQVIGSSTSTQIHQITWRSPPGYKPLQRAKKVMSDSPGLVDFAIGLVIFFLNLPDGQVLFFGEIQITEGLQSILLIKKGLGAIWNDLWASTS